MDNSSAATHSSNAKATSVLEFSSSTSPILDQSTKSLPEVNIQNDSTSKVSTSSCVDNSTNSTNGSSVLNNLGSCGNLTKTAHSPLHDTTLDQMATGTEPTITQTSPLPMLTSPKANPSTPTSQPPSASPSTAQSESDIDLEFEKPDIGCIIDHSELPPLLHAILPKQYTYLFQNVQISKDEECGLVCSADILTNVVVSQKSALQWITDFEEQTKTTFRVTRGTKVRGTRIIFKTMRHCQHKRKASNRALKKTSTLRNKKTECPSHFTLKVHNHRFPRQQANYLSLSD